MRSRVFYTLVVIVALPACSLFPGTGGDSSSEINTDYLTQHWVHSFEEDPKGSAVVLYRPSGYKDFPPSRFRMQYIFEEGGSARWFYLAPDDGHHFKPGTWRLADDEEDVIIIDKGNEIVRYRVLELTRQLLRMTRIDTPATGG